MPLFKGKSSKSTPKKAIDYITNPKKAIITTSNALDYSRDYSKQFKETADLYGKCKNKDERKYYHFKLSCDPKDNITPEKSHELAQKMAEEFFSSYENVISTHNDTKTIHSHIIINSINFETGNKYHCNNVEYAQMKDKINELGLTMNLTPLDWKNKSQDNLTTAEYQIIKKGKESWKDDLRNVITAEIKNSTNFDEFIKNLKKYNITLSRNTEKTISFQHPEKERPIRGEKLGQAYTKGEIVNAINQQRNSSKTEQSEPVVNSNDNRIVNQPSTKQHIVNRTITSDDSAKRNEPRKHTTEKVIDGVQRSVREITEGLNKYSITGRTELRKREEEKRASTQRTQQERKRSQDRQRAIEREHEQRNNSFDLER